MDVKLFLDRYKTIDNVITHTIMPDQVNTNPYLKYGCKLNVPEESIDEFNAFAHKLFFNKNINIPLTESFGEISPLLIDLDLNYEDIGDDVRYYTNDTLKELVDLLHKQINKYFEFDTNLDDNLECWITEKGELPRSEVKDDIPYLKDGIHIIFPNIIGHTKVFKEFVKLFGEDKELSDNIKDIFNRTSINNISPINEINKIFDGNVQRWFTYGCGKPGQKPYLLTKIIKGENQDMIDNEYDSKIIINKICLIKKFEKNLNYKNKIDNILHANLVSSNSVSTFDMFDTDDEDEDLEPDYDPYLDNYNNDEEEAVVNLMNSEKENIKAMVLECFTEERANNYEQWIKVGMCLKNIGGDELFDLFDEFSQKSDSYESIENCKKFWDGFKKDGLTRGSLNYWAKLDNEEAYYEIIERNLKRKIEDCISKGGSHDDIAEVVYGRWKDKFICVDLKDHWLYFDDHKWKNCAKGYILHKSLSGVIKEIFYKYHRIYKREMDKLNDDDKVVEAEVYDKKQKAAYKIYEDLKNVTFCENIMKSCKLKFHIEKMLDKIDSNKNLIGFENAVFDLENNELREGRPDDYITMTNKLNLPIKPNELPLSVKEFQNIIKQRVGKYKKNDKREEVWDTDKWDNGDDKFYKYIFRDISKFFKEILPNKDIRKYCIRFIATRLSGNVLDQRFSIWTGVGANGKKCFN